jgi:hypothetical protein
MKKIFTIFAIAAATFTLNAADIIVTTVADNLGGEDEPDIISGSLREAVANAQSGDVIKLNPVDGNTIELKQAISFYGVNMELVIDGLNQGQPIKITKSAKAAEGTRMINIAAGSTESAGMSITFKNISFEDIATTTSGSAINAGHSSYNTGGIFAGLRFSVILENCRFVNCTAKFAAANSGGGGAVYVAHGTNLIVRNCLFAYNKVEFTDGPDTSKAFGGGAIGSTGTNTASMKIYNSTFHGNLTDGRGGGIHSGHHIDVINCTITGNTSAGQGGGLRLNANSSAANVINTIITHNTGDGVHGDFSSAVTPTTAIPPLLSHNIIGATNFTQDQIDASGPGNDLYTIGQSLFAGGVPVLANNGGWYETVALSEAGMATGAGIATLDGFEIPTTDQRGAVRSATKPSIGAYEYGGVLSGVETANSLQRGIYAAGNQIFFAADITGTVKVYSLSGSCVFQAQVNGGSIAPELPKGVYIVKVVNTANALNVVSKVVLN